jgi:hypothetical protein
MKKVYVKETTFISSGEKLQVVEIAPSEIKDFTYLIFLEK